MTIDTSCGRQYDVMFVGRANVDLIVHVPHRASPGRTTFGSPLTVAPGGKSLNQAIAAAGRGGRCCLVANVGADAWGEQLKTALADSNVDTSYFSLLDHATTGAAIIEVTPDGESYITLALSPSSELTIDDVNRAVDAIDADTVVTQLDLPADTVTALLTRRRFRQMIGNLVPDPDLDLTLLNRLDVLVVNQQEAAAILRTDIDDPQHVVAELQRLGPRVVVVTAGARGAAYGYPDGSGSVPAPAVPVVDTTGAGDAFLGSLAVDLARHIPLADAVATAVRVGSRVVQHTGPGPHA